MCHPVVIQKFNSNHLLQMELMKQTGRKWADDADATNCSACGGQFTITNRKHHCRSGRDFVMFKVIMCTDSLAYTVTPVTVTILSKLSQKCHCKQVSLLPKIIEYF